MICYLETHIVTKCILFEIYFFGDIYIEYNGGIFYTLPKSQTLVIHILPLSITWVPYCTHPIFNFHN